MVRGRSRCHLANTSGSYERPHEYSHMDGAKADPGIKPKTRASRWPMGGDVSVCTLLTGRLSTSEA